MTVGGVTYNESGAYPLYPHNAWNYPIDGVKTHLHSDQIFKVPGQMGFYGSVIIDKQGQVDLDFYGFGEFYGGWKNTLPGANFLKLWNSRPYKP